LRAALRWAVWSRLRQDAKAWLLSKRDATLVQRSGAYFGLPW
jgi:hypothetical protein